MILKNLTLRKKKLYFHALSIATSTLLNFPFERLYGLACKSEVQKFDFLNTFS